MSEGVSERARHGQGVSTGQISSSSTRPHAKQTCLSREVMIDLSLELGCIPGLVEAGVAVNATCRILGQR